jgi:hypothetical protein
MQVTMLRRFLRKPSVELPPRLETLIDNSEPRVRFQLALTVGDFDEDWKYETLARLAQHDFTNRWHSTAILSGLGKSPWIFLRELMKIDAAWLKGTGPEQRRFMDQVANLVGANHSQSEFKAFLALASSNACERSTRFTLFAGFADGVARSGSSSSRMAEAVRGVPNILGDAASATVERKLEAPVRLAALRILVRGFGLLPKGDFSGIVQKLLRPDEPAELQTAAASALGQINDGSLASDVFANWSSYAVPTRRQLLAAAVRTSAGSSALVSALESGDVSIMEADASIRQSLQTKNDADLKPRIAQLFQSLTSTNREALVREFQPTLALSGDRRRGRQAVGQRGSYGGGASVDEARRGNG